MLSGFPLLPLPEVSLAAHIIIFFKDVYGDLLIAVNLPT